MNLPHATTKSEWETPQWVLDAVRGAAGIETFGLDPATSRENPTKARLGYTAEEDGLATPWETDTLWLNPPWGKAFKIDPWVHAFVGARIDRAGFFLAPTSTSARWFHTLLGACDSLLLFTRRVNFVDPQSRQEVKGCPFDTGIFVRGMPLLDSPLWRRVRL